MKPEELTTTTVAEAIARVRLLRLRVPPSARARIDSCMNELHTLYTKLDLEEDLDPLEVRTAAGIVGFVAQLERSSLATPAATQLRSRTATTALRRIAQHADALGSEGAEEGAAEIMRGEAEQKASPSAGPERLTALRGFLERLHARKAALERQKPTKPASGWTVRTHGKPEITEVTCSFMLRLVVSDCSSLPVPAEAVYRVSDPYAVQMTFHTGAEETVQWVFSRELLTGGVRTPVGTGDVRVWPSMTGKGTVCIALSSPEGEALMQAPAGAFQAFLRATHKAVPPGTERKHVNVDAAFPDSPPPPVDSPRRKNNNA